MRSVAVFLTANVNGVVTSLVIEFTIVLVYEHYLLPLLYDQ